MLFVSYTFFSKSGKKGFGNINIPSDGLYSINDVHSAATEIIKPILEKDFNVDVDKVIILNWRKFDPAP